MDEVQVRACNAYSQLSLPETPLLFVEFHGSAAGVEEQSRRFGEIAGEFGCSGFEWATRPEDRSRLWKARHDAYFAARALRPTAKGISTDVCVPISRLAACLAETKADIAATGLIAPIVGHVGDGNFHVLPLIDFGDPAEVDAGHRLRRPPGRARPRLRRHLAPASTASASRTGNTCASSSTSAALAMMRAIKQALDPDDIMNPGKVIPDRQCRYAVQPDAYAILPRPSWWCPGRCAAGTPDRVGGRLLP